MNTKLQYLVLLLALGAAERSRAGNPIPETSVPTVIVNTKSEPVTAGKFQPTWDSLKQYQAPEWFRDAKFGIWAHWGPQCAPEDSDWYARNMYIQGHKQNVYHLAHYGPPSQFGFKDVIHTWKAENFDPEKLVALYKRTGAQYFVALANHHDNFDLWDSKYQPWNAVKIGPQKDLIAGWAKAAHDQGLPFGVSIHASHAWSWYEIAQSADTTGPLAGVPYDGKLTKADGKGKWWDGLDPQDLYEQRHTPSPNYANANAIHSRWDWNNGVSLPDQAYCDKFYNRTVDLMHTYKPDLIYFDDDALPLWPVSDAGLKIAAEFYNFSMKQHDGKLEAVILGKQLNDEERKCIVWDLERGAANRIEPLPWETDTCIGNWHYERALYDDNRYKNAATVIRLLADIVSKNGNLLLNIPVRSDGTIDDKEEAVLQGIAAWMDVNKECIFGTRPWKVFGEGPASEGPAGQAGNFTEGKGKPFTADDARFTTKGGMLYAISLGAPKKDLQIKSMGTAAKLLDRPISNITLLGSDEKVQWSQAAEALTIKAPAKSPNDIAIVFKVYGTVRQPSAPFPDATGVVPQ
ncbi:MAG: alpha-L-fucosidase [Verrucomicrobiota bacterium]|jgi:alpha-L-fucosidase